MSEPEDQEDPQVPGRGFRAIRGGGATARFAPAEAILIRNLAGQVAELVGGDQPLAGEPSPGAEPAGAEPPGAGEAEGAAEAPGAGGPRSGGEDGGPDTGQLEAMFALSDSALPPDDPVLARLLPDAYPDDPAAAGEFRRYTESGLRSGKVAAARTVLDTLPEDGGRIRLSLDEAQAWLRSLNDIRLALGIRLEVTEDRDAMLERAGQGGPQAAGLWIYDWLTLLQETLVEALG
ncbi:MAG: DUF2017 domain-containing protein [Kitasatospora sp.]|nr:DUF2017 domain-containing protein [Kitasatospora sp.]